MHNSKNTGLRELYQFQAEVKMKKINCCQDAKFHVISIANVSVLLINYKSILALNLKFPNFWELTYAHLVSQMTLLNNYF